MLLANHILKLSTELCLGNRYAISIQFVSRLNMEKLFVPYMLLAH